MLAQKMALFQNIMLILGDHSNSYTGILKEIITALKQTGI